MTDRTSALGMLTLNHRSDDHCFSRWNVLGARLAALLAVLGAGLAFLPVTYAQTSKPSNAEKTHDAPPASPMICLEFGCSIRRRCAWNARHECRESKISSTLDALGAGEARGRETLVDRRLSRVRRCSFLALRSGRPSQASHHPNPFEIVQIPGRMFMFFEEQHIWRTIWADGRSLPKIPTPVGWGTRLASGKGTHSLSKRLGSTTSSGSIPMGIREANNRTLPSATAG